MIKRFEIKFPISNHVHLNKWMRYFNLKKSFSDRKIKSTYFDTNNLYLAQQNIDGFSSRFKIRERSYNNETKSKIEIKNKKNKFVEKFFYENFYYTNQNGLYIIDDLKNISKYPKTFLFLKSNKFFKKSFVEYNREYYNINDDLRFTVDTNISFSSFYNNRISIKKTLNYSVLELKTSSLDSSLTYDYLNKLKISPKRFSKYIQSLQMFKRAKYY